MNKCCHSYPAGKPSLREKSRVTSFIRAIQSIPCAALHDLRARDEHGSPSEVQSLLQASNSSGIDSDSVESFGELKSAQDPPISIRNCDLVCSHKVPNLVNHHPSASIANSFSEEAISIKKIK